MYTFLVERLGEHVLKKVWTLSKRIKKYNIQTENG